MVEELSQFNEDFIKKNMMEIIIGYFLEVGVEYSKELFNFPKELPFLPERKKLKKSKNVFVA